MDKNQLARHLLEMNIDKNGNIKKLTGALAKEIHELFQQSDIIINNPADLEKLINSIDVLDLSGREKNALRSLGNTYKEQYPGVLKESIEKKNAQVKIETEARETLNQNRGNTPFLESIDESQKKHVVQKTNPEDAQDIMAEQSPKTWVLKEELEKLEKIINHEEITDEKLQRLLSNLIRNNHNISDEDNQEYLERLTILNNRKNVQKS